MALPEGLKATVVALAASAVAVVCTPWPVPLLPEALIAADQHVQTWQTVWQPIALAIVALAAGRWDLSVLTSGLAVTVPAAVVYGVYDEYFTDSDGTDAWPVAIVVVAPIVFGAAVGLAALGRTYRRRRAARKRAMRTVL
ncbi:hypothetical protein ACFQZ4_01970 [Catellatospora coxensis]|uniref:Uncharacterized protein n=1 Tax=Catellatospora coxensis TaxID=310354 RepID=A0A8J3L476_9ACTN|nr:hypothetical protein [Catellatospora coxensis]GIG08286.1 hypothetical protein Cco03nite_49860 [Catellatospora coxensis]